MTKLFSKDRANKYFSARNGRIFCRRNQDSRTFSTDTGDQRCVAIEMDADCILLAKAIDGVYDSDPKVNPDAKEV